MYSKINNNINIQKMFINDTINKYALKSFYFIPKIKNIKLSFALKNFIFLDYKGFSLNIKENEVKNKAIFTLFSMFQTIPNIKNKNIIINKKSENIENFFLEILIQQKKKLYLFLTSLFIENNFNYFDNSSKNFKNNNKHNKRIEVKMVLPFKNIMELHYLLSSKNLLTDFKDSYVEVIFNINHNIKKEYKKIIPNIPFFWTCENNKN